MPENPQSACGSPEHVEERLVRLERLCHALQTTSRNLEANFFLLSQALKLLNEETRKLATAMTTLMAPRR